MNDGVSKVSGFIADHQGEYETYFRLLVDWNERINLTSITDRDEVFVKHFEDSLLVTCVEEWGALKKGSRVVDVGTGAGFPGLPLAIAQPAVDFVLCDALGKRVQFLEAVKTELGLKNVKVIHGRAEDLARQASFRNQFDAVVSRAVARLNVLAEITMPFARVQGHVFAYKGPSVSEELEDGKRAVEQLGGRVKRIDRMSLPHGQGDRALVVLEQTQITPKTFPRKSGTPQRKPL
jgi:16S rRNA (guanine527-N7)-methyltransferase